MKDILDIIEFVSIIAVGAFINLKRLRILDLNQYPEWVPNFSSLIFMFSVLIILAKIRPPWPKQLKKPNRLVKSLIDLIVILYSMDLLMWVVWPLILNIFGLLCLSASSILYNKNKLLSKWIVKNGLSLLSLGFALVSFYSMLEILEVKNFVKDLFSKFDTEEKVISKPIIKSVSCESPKEASRRKPIYNDRYKFYSRDATEFEENPFNDIDVSSKYSSVRRNLIDPLGHKRHSFFNVYPRR